MAKINLTMKKTNIYVLLQRNQRQISDDSVKNENT